MTKRLELLTRCPFCGSQHDRVSAAAEGRTIPEDGDVTICFQCGKPAIFDSTVIDGGLRPPTPTEKRQLDRDKNVQKVLAAWGLLAAMGYKRNDA